MKNKLINSTIAVGALFLSNVSMAQKINETNAAVAYINRFEPALSSFMDGSSTDLSDAKKALLEAKKFIDLAAAHEDTKGSQKTLYYKGLIYSSFSVVGELAKDTSFASSAGPDAIDVSINAFKSAYMIKGKLNSDIKDAIQMSHDMLDGMSLDLYKKEDFKHAAESFDLEVKYFDVINLVDSNSMYNSGLCYEKVGEFEKAGRQFEKLSKTGYKGASMYAFASNLYRKAKLYDDAKRVTAEGRTKYPQDKDVLLEAVYISLDLNDPVGAEALLTEAISKDPKNKSLYLTIGAIYVDLKQTDKAEAAFNQALVIDPNYGEALRHLGGLYVNMAADINQKLNDLKVGDPKIKTMEAQATEYLTKALVPLEKFIAADPKDIEVLTTLAQVNRFLGNTDKATEYKKRAAELR